MIEVKLTPAEAAQPDRVRAAVERKVGRSVREYRVVRRSIDARKGPPVVVLGIAIGPEAQTPAAELPGLQPVKGGEPILVVGAGPAGYFAALELLFLGRRPIVLERGKDARARRYDLRAIMQEGRVDPHSNYCFGEGGAGTYSDGKLYTRSTKRGDVSRTLRLLVEHGAREEILVDSHPHIGSNKLPGVVESLRQTLLAHGAEIRFETPVTDLWLEDGTLRGVVAGGERLAGAAVILATGHSARDIFELLVRRGLTVEAKPFALGFRAEHPQELIDLIQYRQRPRDPALPAASYGVTCQAGGRGVYSFCMCPGGLIVPAATAPGEIVVNGMSMSGRNSRFANSGVVAELKSEDLDPGPLGGVAVQARLERRAFELGEGQRAPAQRLEDYLAGRVSQDLPRSSYVPGLVSAPLHEFLPKALDESLREGLKTFGQRLQGYRTNEAVLVAVESRTSSPVRVPRDAEGLHHPQLENLYPCGEGAGYAGGIMSAALDGQRVARVVALKTR